MRWPVAGFHTCTVPLVLCSLTSLLAVASILPSGLNATPVASPSLENTV